jgi:alkanesulfonate monooxygenase SsuD/methylene tetrahydromethanopterin reductase-like flavin-dependent oxidoreductase (luciferase family)
MLDEGLDVLTSLCSGEPFQHEGPHYHIRRAQFLPRPVQTPRIPIWSPVSGHAKRPSVVLPAGMASLGWGRTFP